MMEDNPTINLGLLEHNNAAIPITNIDNPSQLDLVDISNDKVVERCKKKFKCDSNKIMQKQTSNKKSKSLTGCLRQLVDNSSVKETSQFEVLCEIRNHLKNATYNSRYAMFCKKSLFYYNYFLQSLRKSYISVT